MPMGPSFPVAILPGVIAEFGRVFELLLRNIGAEAAERLVVSEAAPRDRVVAVAEAQEAAEAHDSVGNTARHLVDDEVVDLTSVLAVGSIDLRPVEIFTRDAVMVRMCGSARHGISP